MPKRVLDFDALWASDKVAACAEWAQAEYAWLYGLADASGSFEMTNLRVIWGRVAAIRKNLALERLEQIFGEFAARGLLFIWQENGKRYGHWTGSDVPGRLPPPSWRARLERLAPPVPRDGLAAYMARFGARRAPSRSAGHRMPAEDAPASRSGFAIESHAGAVPGGEVSDPAGETSISSLPAAPAGGLNGCLEAPQAQNWNRDWEREGGKGKTQVSLFLSGPDDQETRAERCGPSPGDDPGSGRKAFQSDSASSGESGDGDAGHPRSPSTANPEASAAVDQPADRSPDNLLAIYQAERGPLEPAGALTAERRRRSRRRLSAGLTPGKFRAAVRRAAATPFLAGAGERGWRAGFDWFIANDANVRKVLDGFYDPADAGTRGTANGSAAPVGSISSGIFPGALARRGDRVISELRAGAGPLADACGVRAKAATLERILAREAGPPGREALRTQPARESLSNATKNVGEKAS